VGLCRKRSAVPEEAAVAEESWGGGEGGAAMGEREA